MVRETPAEGHGLESHVGLLKCTMVSKSDMGDKTVCSLSPPSVLTSPQNQPSRPLSLWASLDCPSKKCFLLLGGHFCP